MIPTAPTEIFSDRSRLNPPSTVAESTNKKQQLYNPFSVSKGPSASVRSNASRNAQLLSNRSHSRSQQQAQEKKSYRRSSVTSMRPVTSTPLSERRSSRNSAKATPTQKKNSSKKPSKPQLNESNRKRGPPRPKSSIGGGVPAPKPSQRSKKVPPMSTNMSS